MNAHDFLPDGACFMRANAFSGNSRQSAPFVRESLLRLCIGLYRTGRQLSGIGCPHGLPATGGIASQGPLVVKRGGRLCVCRELLVHRGVVADKLPESHQPLEERCFILAGEAAPRFSGRCPRSVKGVLSADRFDAEGRLVVSLFTEHALLLLQEGTDVIRLRFDGVALQAKGIFEG